MLPPIVRGGFEVHLAADAPRVDLQQCLSRSANEPGIVADFIEARAAEAPLEPGWHRLRDFCRAWPGDGSPYARVRDVWIEIDVAETIATPALFFSMQPPSGEPCDRTLIECLAADFMGMSSDSGMRQALDRCIGACPRPAFISHIGAMPSRQPPVVRLNVKRLASDQLIPFLETIGWRGSLHEVAALAAELAPQAIGFTVCLDVGERVHPRIGFECAVAVDPQWQSGWPRFLDRFVGEGVCATEKRDALRHWSGVRLPWMTAGEWPSYLVTASLLHAPDRVGVIKRWHSHLKVDFRPGQPSVVKAYLGFGHWWVRPGRAEKGVLRLPADDPRAANPTSAKAYRDQVQAYYDRTNAEYLSDVGATFQADLVTTDGGDPAASNRQLAAWAGIRPGDRVLDAGCGVAGPAVDIAAAIAEVTIDGITLSPAQARTARERIAVAGMTTWVRVCIGDYHDLPYASAAFDVVAFFESSGYSDDRPRLFREVLRVLRPGGTLYIKDAFCRAGPLSPADARGLADFDRIYAHRTPLLADTVALLEQIGFAGVAARDLTGLVDKRHWRQASGTIGATTELTPFGELHAHDYESLPVFTAEIRARAPL